jgi:uncharacterized protein with von Willebrand factor type A (vWA) domain
MHMLFVIRNGKVFATHSDTQNVVDKYPQNYDIIQISDAVAHAYLSQFGEGEEIPDPRTRGIDAVDVRVMGTYEQKIADLEEALAQLLGGGLG